MLESLKENFKKTAAILLAVCKIHRSKKNFRSFHKTKDLVRKIQFEQKYLS